MKVTIKTRSRGDITFKKGDRVKVLDDCLMPYFRNKEGEIKQLDHYTCLVQGKGMSVWISYHSLEVL